MPHAPHAAARTQPAPRTQNGHHGPGQESAPRPKRQVETLGFFDVLYRITEAHTIQLIVNRAGTDLLRVTILCSQRPSEDADKKDGEAAPAPIANRVLVGPPAEFDAPDGVVQFFRESAKQAHTLAEAREKADRAHDLAVKAEKKRAAQATAKKKNADPGGPLFTGSDAEEGADDSESKGEEDTADE